MTEVSEQPASSVLPHRFVGLLSEILDRDVSTDQLSAEMTLADLDIDSFTMMELVAAAEDEYGIHVPDEALQLAATGTLADMARVFERAL